MWHFLAENKRLGFGDGREVVVGQTICIKGEPRMCSRGLHASASIIDALLYSHDYPTICRVDLGGTVKRGDDKSVGTERTVLWWVDAADLLAEFACRCAVRALDAAGVKDKNAWKAIAAKRVGLRNAERIAGNASAMGGSVVKAAACDAMRAACFYLPNRAARTSANVSREIFGLVAARGIRSQAKRDEAWRIGMDRERVHQNRSLAAMVVATHRPGEMTRR